MTSERPASNLRGRLAEVYWPALLGQDLDALVVRLGERASTYDAGFGAAVGIEAIRKQLERLATWWNARQATHRATRTIVGPDRDVCEGILTLQLKGKSIELPMAVVCERHPAREVDIRILYATAPVGLSRHKGHRRTTSDVAVPHDIGNHLAALRLGDVRAIAETFESQATLVDGHGVHHDRQGGALEAYYGTRLPRATGASTWVPLVFAVVDDGRRVAIEYDTADTDLPGLFVFERGDSGLLSSVQLYDEQS